MLFKGIERPNCPVSSGLHALYTPPEGARVGFCGRFNEGCLPAIQRRVRIASEAVVVSGLFCGAFLGFLVVPVIVLVVVIFFLQFLVLI
jgi:hypothetical protein